MNLPDPEDLTLNELEEFEEQTGLIATQMDWNAPPIKAIKVFIWLMRRREEPELTLEESGSIRIGDLDWDQVKMDPPDPNGKGAQGAPADSSRSSRSSSGSTAASRRKTSGV